MLDDDFGYDAPARKKAARKPRAAAAGRKKKKTRRLNISANRIARYGAIGMSATVVVGIMVNALLMQKGHHPAPLFGKNNVPVHAAAGEPLPKAPAASSQPSAASEPAPTSVANIPAPIDTGKAARAAIRRSTTDASSDDPIGRLLNGSAPTSTEKSTAEKGTGDKTVLGVQKALAKLGFAVKANGTFGPTTKKAIEAFEKDRHLPVKGEVNHRIAKVLAAASGLRIE